MVKSLKGECGYTFTRHVKTVSEYGKTVSWCGAKSGFRIWYKAGLRHVKTASATKTD